MNISDDQLDVADWRKVQSVEHIGTMLSCVCNAVGNAQAEQNKVLERIATALEAGHNEPAAATLMRGVGLDPDPAKEGAYTKVPGIEFYAGIAGFGGVYRDETNASWFAMDMDQEFRAYSPDELRDVAELFRTHYAEALEWVAMQWQEQLDADTVSLLPPESMNDDIADEDNEDNELED